MALNQISAGLAGIITVGHVNDYVCRSTFCSLLLPQIGVRHIILKDTQILPDGSQQTQEDPAFSDPKPDPGEGQQLGITAGADTTNMGGRNYKSGNWYFTGERSVSC